MVEVLLALLLRSTEIEEVVECGPPNATEVFSVVPRSGAEEE